MWWSRTPYCDSKATEGAISALTLSTVFCDYTEENDNSVKAWVGLCGQRELNQVHVC